MDAHIDMTEYINNLADRLAQDTMRQAICEGNPKALAKLQREGSLRTTVDLQKEIPLGQRQVESLLSFVISKETELALTTAGGNNFIYDALGEHRILGRAKKKKKSRITDY